jgi:HEAT repeat protein
MEGCECPGDDSASCPECATGGKPPDSKKFEKLRKQVSIEHKLLGEVPYVVIQSPHFYLVCDIPSVKVLTQNGSKRDVGTHELAHLYIQRAEVAYEDFVGAFGAEIRGSRRIGIFLNRRKQDSERLQTEYFGRSNAGLVYGQRLSGVPPISGGYCEAGLAIDAEQATSDDALFQRMRTLEGSVLMSLWSSPDAKPSHLPMWVFIGAGHWLGRLPNAFKEQASFIGGEGNMIRDPGNEWTPRLAKAIGKGDFPHVDSYFGFTTLSQTDLTTHMRSWAWFSYFVEEDRERFVRLVKLIRSGKNQREAVQEAFGCTAEELDARLRERVTGKRKTLADPKAPQAGAGSGGFADLKSESDPKTIADRIKARTVIDDPADAAALVDLLDHDADLVNERVVLALSKARAERVREYLRGDALAKNRGRKKAGVVRILGLAKDDDAADAVQALLADPDDDVKAQAALALGRMRHEPAVKALRPLLADKSEETLVAAMDALAMFGEAACDEWMRVSPNLDDPRRNVRTAAAECLGELASMESIDALIGRMEKEEGRVRADIRGALKKIARDDLGESPSFWREWWKKEKARAAGRTPGRPEEKPKEEAKPRYAEGPTFYGIQLYSKRLVFLLDVSSSMNDHIVVDPEWLRASGRVYKGNATKFDLAEYEIGEALRGVDPRLEFGIVTFRSEVRTWKERLVPAGTGVVDQAISYLEGQRPPSMNTAGDITKQRTNVADALRIALGIKRGTNGRATADAADEAYIMTDGAPTAGDLVDPDVLLSWFKERNRLARLRLHVVTFQTIDTDLKFLQALASAGGGAFVAIPAKSR